MNLAKLDEQFNYYMVIMNPKLHRKTFNAIKLFFEVAEAKYVIYVDEEISKMELDYKIEHLELHSVTKEDFKKYQYNPN